MDIDCRPCTIAAAVGFALDLSNQSNIEVESLNNIIKNGYQDEQQVRKALREFVDKVPKEKQTEAKSISCFAFEDEDACNTLLPLSK